MKKISNDLNMKNEMKEIAIQVTNYCNLKCKMCGLWEIKKHGPSFDTIIQVLKDSYELGARIFSPFGGECLMREDFLDIVEQAEKIGYTDQHIISNATLINDKVISRYKNYKSVKLHISIDGPPEIHNSLRGNGVYEKAVANLRKIKENQISVYLSSIIMKKTLPHLKHVVDLTKELEIPWISLQPFQKDFANPAVDLSDCIFEDNQREYVESQLDELIRYTKEKQIGIYTESFFKEIPDYLFKGIKPKPYNGCYKPSKFLLVTTEGLVFPCFFMFYKPMGDINKNSIKDIWYSPMHKKYISLAIAKRCPGCLAACSDIETQKADSK